MRNGGGLLDADALASHASILPASSNAEGSNTNVLRSKEGRKKGAGASKRDGETS
jgi:hypothetical protein